MNRQITASHLLEHVEEYLVCVRNMNGQYFAEHLEHTWGINSFGLGQQLDQPSRNRNDKAETSSLNGQIGMTHQPTQLFESKTCGRRLQGQELHDFSDTFE